MPIYEYDCARCAHRFEEYFASSTQKKAVKCPECGSKKVERAFSMFGMSVGGGNASGGGGSSCDSCTSTSCDSCGG